MTFRTGTLRGHSSDSDSAISLNDINKFFLQGVREGRNLDDAQMRRISTGELWIAWEAAVKSFADSLAVETSADDADRERSGRLASARATHTRRRRRTRARPPSHPGRNPPAAPPAGRLGRRDSPAVIDRLIEYEDVSYLEYSDEPALGKVF